MLSYYYIIWLYYYIIISEYYHIIILLYYISILYFYIGERLWGSSFLGSLRGEAPHKLQVGGEGEALPPQRAEGAGRGPELPGGGGHSEHVSDANSEHASEVPEIIVLGINRVAMAPFGPIFGQIESHGSQEAFANPPASPGAHIRPKTDQNFPNPKNPYFYIFS